MYALSLDTTIAEDHVLKVTLPPDFPSGPVKVTVESLNLTEDEFFQPRTELGRHLLEIRRLAIAEGMKLLSQDEVLEEMRRRRGEDE